MSGLLQRPISVLIPVYGAPDQLKSCLESLVKHLPAGVDVLVMDDATPEGGIEPIAELFAGAIPGLSFVRRGENLGFVGNCNEGMRAVLESGSDILLLNSDTEITAGALEEMSAVLHAHEKHGAVCPRSNNATIFSIPLHERLEPGESYEVWQRLRGNLTRFHIMPTCVGFCMLIRNEVLRYFGLFDPIYSPGYNEENDLVCRMNRHGYSPLVANHAFVFHHESASFGGRRKELETRNRNTLDARYPEYARMVEEYFRYRMDPVERLGRIFTKRRKRILVDLHHIEPHHSGTSEFAFNLLLYLTPMLERRYDVVLGANEAARGFLEAELAGYQFFDETRSPGAAFDIVFKPCQLFFWSELHRMARLGARLCYTHQDSIAIRCRHLCAISAELLQRTVPSMVEKVVAISEFTRADYEVLHGRKLGGERSAELIYQATEGGAAGPAERNGILVVGSGMQHKGVDSAVRALLGMRETRAGDIVVLGGAPKDYASSGVRWLKSGHLGKAEIRALYAGAAVVVYPSYYEGFGLPVLDGLAAGCHVIVLETLLNRELERLTGSPLLHVAASHAEIREIAESLLAGGRVRTDVRPQRSWVQVAEEYDASLEELMNREIDADLIRRRWHWLATIDSLVPIS